MTDIALAAPRNTLEFQLKGRPMTTHRELKATVHQVMKHLTIVKDEPLVTPEVEALKFYLLNHAVSVIRGRRAMDEPLPPGELSLLEDYHVVLTQTALRLLKYLILICSRETRHASEKHGMYDQMEQKFGGQYLSFHKAIKGHGASQVISRVNDHPPNMTIDLFASALAWTFYHGGFGGGFGGKKWGAIADCLAAYCSGKYTAEMMMDVGWSLSHNNGPIFNKGMQYNHYNPTLLLMILDCQRAGQIPELIVEHAKGSMIGYVGEIDGLVAKVADVLPDMFARNWVDWHMVREMGAVGNYAAYAKKQDAAGHQSPYAPKPPGAGQHPMFVPMKKGVSLDLGKQPKVQIDVNTFVPLTGRMA